MRINIIQPKRIARVFVSLGSLLCLSIANAFTITISSDDINTTAVFSSVETFQFDIDVDAPLQVGEYADPMLNQVDYAVSGTLVSGTPSGFPAFELVRSIEGVAFYEQGSSLWFEIDASADLSDGVQVSELVPNSEGELFVFNGREIDNGRFHPALFVLNSDGTGRIQNSNNVPVLGEAEVPFGAEYITDLVFDQASLSLVQREGSSGGGAAPWWLFVMLVVLTGCSVFRRTPSNRGQV